MKKQFKTWFNFYLILASIVASVSLQASNPVSEDTSIDLSTPLRELEYYDSLYQVEQRTPPPQTDGVIDYLYQGRLNLYEKETDQDLEVEFAFYSPVNHNEKLIVITPNIDGITPLENRLRNVLMENNYTVLIIKSLPIELEFDETTCDQMERLTIRAIVSTRRAIEFLSQTNRFHMDSMGLLGASLGGIRSSILFGLDHRFKSIFVAVAGSDFPSLYATSLNTVIAPLRRDHMAYMEMTDPKDYENYLRENLYLDPSMAVKSPHLENFHMLISDDDNVVPTWNQWNLWREIRDAGVHPRTYQTDYTHVPAALKMLMYTDDMLRLFDRTL